MVLNFLTSSVDYDNLTNEQLMLDEVRSCDINPKI